MIRFKPSHEFHKALDQKPASDDFNAAILRGLLLKQADSPLQINKPELPKLPAPPQSFVGKIGLGFQPVPMQLGQEDNVLPLPPQPQQPATLLQQQPTAIQNAPATIQQQMQDATNLLGKGLTGVSNLLGKGITPLGNVAKELWSRYGQSNAQQANEFANIRKPSPAPAPEFFWGPSGIYGQLFAGPPIPPDQWKHIPPADRHAYASRADYSRSMEMREERERMAIAYNRLRSLTGTPGFEVPQPNVNPKGPLPVFAGSYYRRLLRSPSARHGEESINHLINFDRIREGTRHIKDPILRAQAIRAGLIAKGYPRGLGTFDNPAYYLALAMRWSDAEKHGYYIDPLGSYDGFASPQDIGAWSGRGDLMLDSTKRTPQQIEDMQRLAITITALEARARQTGEDVSSELNAAKRRFAFISGIDYDKLKEAFDTNLQDPYAFIEKHKVNIYAPSVFDSPMLSENARKVIAEVGGQASAFRWPTQQQQQQQAQPQPQQQQQQQEQNQAQQNK